MGDLLVSLKQQTLRPREVIIVDSESNDATVEIAQSLGSRVIRIKREKFRHGLARNMGAEIAQGSIIVFLTQDAIPEGPHTMERLILPLNDPGIGVTYGRQVAPGGAPLLEKFFRQFNYPPVSVEKGGNNVKSLGVKAFFLSNVCSAVRRELFWSLGGFPTDVIVSEDLLFGVKVIKSGHKILYVAEAKVIHWHDYSLGELLRRYFDIGVVFAQHKFLRDLRVKGEGGRYAIELLRFLAQKGAYGHIFRALLEIGIRGLGFYLGRHYQLLPKFLRKKLSRHPSYWS